MSEPSHLRFACDAMLGGLARWLRAAGYDTGWHPHVNDWDLIRLAEREGRLLLSSDTGLFRIGILRDGELPALWIPHGLTNQQQLAHVLRALKLPLLEPRCMACGGELASVSKDNVKDLVPPRSLAWAEEFWQCARCQRVFWQGTHWQRIARDLENAAAYREGN